MQFPYYIQRLMEAMRGLPGVGSKTAERYAFEMIQWPRKQLEQLAGAIGELPDALSQCPSCGCLTEEEKCLYCDPSRRDAKTLCLVASSKEVFAIEATRSYRGLYHVLGGLLSPLEGRGPEALRLTTLRQRLPTVEEAIIALDSTVEGDATSLFLKGELEQAGVRVSRLAFGLPMGSPLDYVDPGTLTRALSGRGTF